MNEYIDSVQIKKIESDLISDDLDTRTSAILFMAYEFYRSDWVLRRLVDLTYSSDTNVKSLAITCIGHIARLRGGVDKKLVIPVLENLLNQNDYSGFAQDALDDIEIFAKD